MNLVVLLVQCFALLSSTRAGTINHDQVQPFAQPVPVTIAERAAVKFKPQLYITQGRVSFPAVNAAGETSGGLKVTKGTEGCSEAPLGSQVCGRSTWYQDKWAMVFAWYFPKSFWDFDAKDRHYWASMVLWLDNPALHVETPKILGASLSHQLQKRQWMATLTMAERRDAYFKQTNIPPMGFVGTQQIAQNRISRRRWNYTYVGGSNVSTRISTTYWDSFEWLALTFSEVDGKFQDLIVWEQLTDDARAALNSAEFGESKVPLNDHNLENTLKLAYPFLQ
ncbi:NPP1-like protein [Phytophthora infestans T30-4]|uniref:NPP1-like protein n=1 Tax=Phytophthora infestans (strain T30-4) TaxID=403677 RepID=D0NRZ4_PHYIT|nr:NPP1-like protein [Phytophthora infestans T30-4]EEY63535.1 NPP1-like protein [Phytophthora infestans T30-4]|eukprot:XP_002898122.1 NPP1-like protein [Phytophthora infestans T30-4]